ncbi:MAG: MlaD family protein [Flavobacteriaceae bacterium]|nr:MlaD family protein [Flavobacteriaceae bacterium]
MKISREIKTAILVLGAIALLIWGYSFIKGTNMFDNSTKYYVEYDNVEGLTTSSNVTINGLIVGKVSKIEINPQSGKLVVEILMTNPLKISKESVATIYSPGFIGGKNISIDPIFGNTNYAESKDFLKGAIQLDMTEKLAGEIAPLQKKLVDVLENANAMLGNVNTLLDDKMQADLKGAIAQLNGTLAGANSLIANSSPKLDKTLTNLNTMSGNFSALSSDLNKLDIQATFAKLDSSLANVNSILADIQAGKGTVGLMLKDEQVYKNLDGATKELEQLMRDLKENPKRYVHFSLFGKKATPYQESGAEGKTEAKK